MSKCVKSQTLGVIMFREYLDDSGKSLSQLEKELKISRQTLAKYLKGECEPCLKFQIFMNKKLGLINDWVS